MYSKTELWSINIKVTSIIGMVRLKVKVVHLYSITRSTAGCPICRMLYICPPPQQGYSTQPWCEDSRKLPTYPPRLAVDLSAFSCYDTTSTHLHLSGVKPCQFKARECSTQATWALTLASLKPTTAHTWAKNHTTAPLMLRMVRLSIMLYQFIFVRRGMLQL